MFRQKIFLAFLVWLGCSTGLFGAGWAILPVKAWNMEAVSQSVTEGPKLQGSGEELSWDLARSMRAYLSAGMITNIIPMQEVKKAYEELRYTPQMALTAQDLQRLAALLDADNLLLTNVYGENKMIRVESSVFYAHSQINADLISARGVSFWEVFGQVSRERFPSFFTPGGSGETRYHLIFGIDAQGKNYRDIPQLSRSLKLLSPEYTAITAVDGHLNRHRFAFQASKDKAIEFLSALPARGSGKEEQLYVDLLQSIESMVFPGDGEGLPQDGKIQLILVVGGRPSSPAAQKRIRTYIRKIRERAGILILGTGSLSPAARDYWIDIAAEFNLKKPILYRDVVYRQKIGLSSGHELYLFKNGASLFESNSGLLQDAHEVPLGRVRRAQLTPYNMVEVFQENAQARVISQKEVEIRMVELIKEFTDSNRDELPEDQGIRVLVEVGRKPFWISIPKSVYYDAQNRPLLEKGGNYYLMLHLLPGKLGQPFRNRENFARIFSYAEAPQSLLLPLDDYLQNPSNYLQKSIGNSSLYCVFVRVVDIRIPQKFTY